MTCRHNDRAARYCPLMKAHTDLGYVLNCVAWAPTDEAEMRRLRDENAKLRRLSATMLKCIEAHKRNKLVCWECPAHKQFDELRWLCCIAHDASELGVEMEQ